MLQVQSGLGFDDSISIIGPTFGSSWGMGNGQARCLGGSGLMLASPFKHEFLPGEWYCSRCQCGVMSLAADAMCPGPMPVLEGADDAYFGIGGEGVE